MNGAKFKRTQRGKSAERLEGSRFAIRQLCNLAASGSRERLVVVRFYRSGARPSPSEQRPAVKASRWAVPGSRLLPCDRTAELQSGSPPGFGRCGAVFLRRATKKRHSS